MRVGECASMRVCNYVRVSVCLVVFASGFMYALVLAYAFLYVHVRARVRVCPFMSA